MQEKVKKPYQARDSEEFDRFEKQAKAFKLPPEYAGPWQDTRLAKRLKETQAEYGYLHCGKAGIRSTLWDPATWPDDAALPSAAQVLRDHVADGRSLAEVQQQIDESYASRLW